MAKKTHVKVRLVPESKPDSPFFYYVKKPAGGEKAKKIIIACGAWSGELINRSFNLSFPIRPIKGISMLVDAGRELFKNNLWFRNIYVAQRTNNILSIGATEQERGFDENIRMDEVYYLAKNIWESFVDLESMKLIDIKCGIRPGVIDGKD